MGLRFHFAPTTVEPRLFAMLASRSDADRLRGARALRYIGIDLRHVAPVVVTAAGDPVAAVRADVLRLFADLVDADSALISVAAVREVALLSMEDADAEVRRAAELLLEMTSSGASTKPRSQRRGRRRSGVCERREVGHPRSACLVAL